MADVRQLRNNLTTLLEDGRLAAMLVRQEVGAPPKPLLPTPSVRIERGGMDGSCWTDFCCGKVIVEVPDVPHGEIAIYNLGGDQQSIPDAERNITHLNTILSDPRFVAMRQQKAA